VLAAVRQEIEPSEAAMTQMSGKLSAKGAHFCGFGSTNELLVTMHAAADVEPAGAVEPAAQATHADAVVPALELYVLTGHAKGVAAAHVPVGSVHVHDALVVDVVTAEAAVTEIALSTDPLAERTSSVHPPRAAVSAAIEGE
jgi:hypothetical protein